MRIPVLAAIVTAVAACAEPPALGSSELASEVADHETSTCSTAVVLELSRQIAVEVDCLAPGQLVPFAEGGGIVFTGNVVLPYVPEGARDDLLAAVASTGGRLLELTSAFRTVAQQYLLYRWYQLGRCDIAVAARPGESNHESGRAIDIRNYASWTSTLPGFGWARNVPGDEVHFEHLASPDLRGTDVLAFQRLWNRNFPDDRVDEDGVYGPMTEERLQVAPAEGFAVGPMCAPGGLALAVERVVAPRALPPGARATVELTLRNTGTTSWPAGTALVTAEPPGRPSALHDASWPAPDHAATIDVAVAPGDAVIVELAIVAPAVAAPVELTETFALDAGNTRFGAIALVITIDAGAPTPGDTGGCDAGGGSALPLALLGLAALRRRRRSVTSHLPPATDTLLQSR